MSGVYSAVAPRAKPRKRRRPRNQAAANNVNQAVGTAAGLGYAGIAQSNSAINNGVNTANNAINSGTNLANQEIASAGQGQAAVYGDMTSGLQPYQTAGTYGLNKLQSTAGTFNFDSTNLQNDPGYQFQLQQGMKALSNQGSAAGLLNSGSTLKAMANYSQGLAGTSYQNAYNRALTTYNTNQQGYQTLANLGTNANSQQIQAGSVYGSQIGQLAGLQSGTNMQGASMLGNTAMQGAGLLSNTAMQGNQWIGNQTMTGANVAGNFLVGMGNAQAAGAIGTGERLERASNGVGNAFINYSSLQSLNNLRQPRRAWLKINPSDTRPAGIRFLDLGLEPDHFGRRQRLIGNKGEFHERRNDSLDVPAAEAGKPGRQLCASALSAQYAAADAATAAACAVDSPAASVTVAGRAARSRCQQQSRTVLAGIAERGKQPAYATGSRSGSGCRTVSRTAAPAQLARRFGRKSRVAVSDSDQPRSEPFLDRRAAAGTGTSDRWPARHYAHYCRSVFHAPRPYCGAAECRGSLPAEDVSRRLRHRGVSHPAAARYGAERATGRERCVASR